VQLFPMLSDNRQVGSGVFFEDSFQYSLASSWSCAGAQQEDGYVAQRVSIFNVTVKLALVLGGEKLRGEQPH
jgi:hypothetical protein